MGKLKEYKHNEALTPYKGVYSYETKKGTRYRYKRWTYGGKLLPDRGGFTTAEECDYERRLAGYGHHWHGMAEDREDYFGFTYTITERATGRKYLGAKQFYYWDGPVRGYKCTDPSDEDWDESLWKSGEWRKYTSSSKVITSLIGSEPWNFKFEVNKMHRCKLDLFKGELDEQIEADVLNAVDADGNYVYLNEQIMGVEYRPPVPKAKLKAAREAGLKATREYYLRPSLCEDCGTVIPYGTTECPGKPVFGNGGCTYERAADGTNN